MKCHVMNMPGKNSTNIARVHKSFVYLGPIATFVTTTQPTWVMQEAEDLFAIVQFLQRFFQKP